MNKVGKVNLATLKSELPRGYTAKLSNRLGLSRGRVSQVLGGKNIMHPVVLEAIKLRDEYQEKLQSISQALQK